MRKILLVEDSKVFGAIMQKSIQSKLRCIVDWYRNMEDARQSLQNCSENYITALLDLNLPDAPDGEIVDFVAQFNIPIIVFTAEVSNEVRERIWSKRIVDYVLKEDSDSIHYIIKLINSIETNHNIKILVVDDSSTMRNMFTKLLQIHQYNVLSAEDGKTALQLIKQNPDIKLITIDYNMPDMNGVELIKQIRKKYSKDALSIIGISSSEDKWISARFIKSGANDFLSKPFINEEFYCRIIQNIHNISYIETITELANKDSLTGLFNRRYFYEYAESMFRVANQKEMDVNVAILDIDHFKKVNDNYGHDAGDAILKHFADNLKCLIKSPNIVARIGGEEFAIITIGENLNPVFEKIRKETEKATIEVNSEPICITISAGVCIGKPEDLGAMLKIADNKLYNAKEQGRNRVLKETLT